jgi:hypothetical protein
MDNLDSNKYISLKTAAGLYGYTRDHLGLMIRQGKLRGIKLGSYYVTTNKWMVDFIKNFADLNHPTSRNKLSNKFLTKILASKGETLISANNKNFAEKTSKKIISEKASKNTVLKDVIDSDFGKKILKELTQYKSSAEKKASKTDINQVEKAVLTYSGAPYIILPVRKMKRAEREEVLNKLNPPEDGYHG